MAKLFHGLEALQIAGVLDPLLDIAAFGANKLANPDVEAGQVDRYATPAVEHRRTPFAADRGRIAFGAFFIVFHRGHLMALVIANIKFIGNSRTGLGVRPKAYGVR